MARQLSNQLLNQLYMQESSDPFLMLITFSHPLISEPIRLVNNVEDIISRGETFFAFPMQIKLPTDDGETTQEVELSIDNTTLELIDELRTIQDPLDVKIEMILASEPDSIQVEMLDLKLRNISYDKSTIKGRVAVDDILSTEMPGELYTPQAYPGLF